MYAALAAVFIAQYIVGIPLGMFVALFRNRKALYDESHPRHQDVFYELGGMYAQYEPAYYWFEIVIVFHKSEYRMVLFFVLARAVFLTLFSSVPFATGML